MPRRASVLASMLGLGAVGGAALALAPNALEAHAPPVLEAHEPAAPEAAVTIDAPEVVTSHEAIVLATVAAPEPPLAAWIEAARRVTVRVGDRSGASGSGTIVSREGHVLTALHVVAGVSGRVLVTTPDGIAHRARVLHRDEAHDLALLDLDGTTRDCAPRSVGDPHDAWLAAAGFAGALAALRAPSITVGTRLGPEPLPAGAVVAPRELASVHVAPGMSGGPVLDGRGALVGIVVAMGGFASLDAVRDATWLSDVACDAPLLTPSLPAVVENEHHEPDRDASLAASLPAIDRAMAEHTVDLHVGLGVTVSGIVVAPELVLTLAGDGLAVAPSRATQARLDRPRLDLPITLVETDGELALVRIAGLPIAPIAHETGRSRARVGELLRGAVMQRPGVVGAIDERPGLLRPFVPTPPGRRCGTLLAMRRASSPDVLLDGPVLAHDAAAMRGELLLDARGAPVAIHVGHHTSGLGYAVELRDALARLRPSLRE